MCKWNYLTKEPEMVPFSTEIDTCGVSMEWKTAALLTENGSLFEANLETGGVLYTGLRFEGLISPSILVNEDSIVLISERRVLDIERFGWKIRSDLRAHLPNVNWEMDDNGRIVARYKSGNYITLTVRDGVIHVAKINDLCVPNEGAHRLGIFSKVASTPMTMRIGSFEAQFKIPRGYNHLWDMPRFHRGCEFILTTWAPGKPMLIADL